MTHESLALELGSLCSRTCESFGMPVLETSGGNLFALVGRLRKELGFDLLLDVTAIDYPERRPRFVAVYHLFNSACCQRVRIKVEVPDHDPSLTTLTTLYGSARFLEREVHEMYGIRFTGNDDLRPILLYEGFVGHPLRKDYPIDREQPIVDYRR
ncbi:NADH-quinone oxidoreductase subunit C [Geomonas sp.]|uniref:NADH-quinone oxidoreductase subunit C n=1 Tax=Geomonas sp. TaxID=2651584 RepID=UPI002B477E0D|nr:NADH-quinone oxidoreductase subunit C [Geomonas sp.]HJV35094.1 NADH-quinone oxidoreductase subunit C [Geomonas sp.]